MIQAAILLRRPTCIMAADIKDDFAASFSVLSRVAETSLVAKRSLRILLRLRERLDQTNNQTLVTSTLTNP